MVSGTQGEPMSALSRVAVDNHKHLSLQQGDTVVLSSRIIPGNEKGDLPDDEPHGAARRGLVYGTHESADSRLRPRQRRRAEAGAESGPAALSSCRSTANTASSRKHAHSGAALRFAGLEETFVLETGETLEIDQARRAPRRKRSPSGRVCIDSGSLDDVVEDIVIRDRRHLSEDGFVLPIIAINKHTGKSEGLPEIVSRGFVAWRGRRDFAGSARQWWPRRSKHRPPKSAAIGA